MPPEWETSLWQALLHRATDTDYYQADSSSNSGGVADLACTHANTHIHTHTDREELKWTTKWDRRFSAKFCGFLQFSVNICASEML